MALLQDEKSKIIGDYALSEGDTGSSQVQIALLTSKISKLTGHLKEHKKDFHSRLGLLKMVGQRRRLLKYLKIHNEGEYANMIKSLKLRHIN